MDVDSSPILKDAMQNWGKMSQDPAFRMSYEARQKALIDEASAAIFVKETVMTMFAWNHSSRILHLKCCI